MDPKKLSQLDPKLRDAYQRVMGTVIPEPQAKSDLAQATPVSPKLQRDEPIQTQIPPIPTPPPMPNPTPVPNPTFPQPPASEPQSIPTPAPTIPEPPVFEPQPAIAPQPEPIPTPEPAISPQQPPVQANNFVQMNSEVPTAQTASPNPNFTAPAKSDLAPIQTQTMTLKKKNRIMPILFGIVGLIFIVIYALFWTKIFNLKLPFLP